MAGDCGEHAEREPGVLLLVLRAAASCRTRPSARASSSSGSSAFPPGPTMRMFTMTPPVCRFGGRSISSMTCPPLNPAVAVDAHVAHGCEHAAHEVLVGQLERDLELVLGAGAVRGRAQVRPLAVSASPPPVCRRRARSARRRASGWRPCPAPPPSCRRRRGQSPCRRPELLFTSASPRRTDGSTRPASIRRRNPGPRPGADKKRPVPRRGAPGGTGRTDSKSGAVLRKDVDHDPAVLRAVGPRLVRRDGLSGP